MVDMHSHILPGVDDGAEFYDESHQMLDIAVQNGTEMLVLTPHYTIASTPREISAEELNERFEIFSQKAARDFPNLSLMFGAELFISESMLRQPFEKCLVPINNTSYVLIEFDFHEQAYIAEYALEKIIAAGYRPIVAHPERYRMFYRDVNLCEKFIQKGCLFQMNAGSPFGQYGSQAEEFSYWMLRREYVHCVGSDAHSPYQRTPDMSQSYAFVSMHFSQKYCHQIFKENPRIILSNDIIKISEEPI